MTASFTWRAFEASRVSAYKPNLLVWCPLLDYTEFTHTHIFFVFCRQERQRYYTNRQLSFEDSKEYLSVIIDGMDQNKTCDGIYGSTSGEANIYRG